MSELVSKTFHRVLRADPISVRRTLTDLRHCFAALPEDVIGRLELVLAEVLNNVVEHGHSPPAGLPARPGDERRGRAVHLYVHQASRELRAIIADNGVVLPNDCLAPRGLPPTPGELPEGGFGWFLIHDLVSTISYAREGGRNYLAFSLPVAEERPVAA